MEPSKYFMELDRERAKIGLNPDQLAYVEALEKVAHDAFDLWMFRGLSAEQKGADDLYDSLSVVNFMQDDMK